jgi:RNA polymerase sigma-54 factor
LNTFIWNDMARNCGIFGCLLRQRYIRRSIADMVDDMAFTQGMKTDENGPDA